MLTAIIGASVLIWVYLAVARGTFWTMAVRDSETPTAPAKWPGVAVVIPARNEADSIGKSLRSLLDQNYPGAVAIIVVDDDSSDGTAAVAANAVKDEKNRSSVTIANGRGLPADWTGKLWAVSQGIEIAEAQQTRPDYVLLTDADIVHAPDTLTWLVSKANAGGLVLTSLLAKLRCESFAERVHVPAFVFFFQMLFPFAWVSRADSATAAAAGGCMLVRADALRDCGGIESIKGALIDDCALAKKLKSRGPIWVGLTNRARSLRSYERFSAAKEMISRTAYAQLRNSPLLLALTIAGMAITFIVPALFAIFGNGLERYLGIAAWVIMAALFQPVLRFYRVSPLWGFALPGIAALYGYYTLYSAYRHMRKRGGLWKGRVYTDALKPL